MYRLGSRLLRTVLGNVLGGPTGPALAQSGMSLFGTIIDGVVSTAVETADGLVLPGLVFSGLRAEALGR